ncbi:MAG TPA: alpha/beta hydrolase, partial [Rhodospirillaceae bacterium]|nr:alpha/beta hydrolase [Rhodospirillaceae bacterium]
AEAMAEYQRCFAMPGTIHASCEDYRAAAGIDLIHDEADLDQKITCPLLVLWGAKAPMHKHYDVLETWRDRAVAPEGHAIESGHFLAEENPTDTLAAFKKFFKC